MVIDMKTTKVDRLKQELEAAKAELAATPLKAQLIKANENLKALRETYDQADAANWLAYSSHKDACEQEALKMGLTDERGAPSDKLLASLKEFADASNCQAADLRYLARMVITRELGRVERITRLFTTYNEATTLKDKAYRAWNVASNPTGAEARIRYQLQALRDKVAKLEAEIERTPRRNEAAREKRDEARQEEIASNQTKDLRGLLHNFTFKAE